MSEHGGSNARDPGMLTCTPRTVPAAAPQLPPRSRPRIAEAWLVPGVPALVALLVNLWRLDTPALWRDEAATLSAAQRPLGDLFRMLGEIDAVHGAYYVVMHGVTEAFGIGATAVRMPSVIAAAVAAGGTAMLGRRLAGTRVGLMAGLLLATSPMLSRYAQEARQYSVTTALAVVATCLFVRAIDRGSLPWFAGYAASIALVGWIHLFTLLLLPVHVLALWAVRREGGLLIRWVVATAAGLATVVPLVLMSMPQSKKQVEWIAKPQGKDVTTLLDYLAGAHLLVIPVLGLAALALWRPFDRESRVDLRVVALAWSVLPPALLLGISLIEPYYVMRYVVFAVPGVALTVAAGLRRIPLWGSLPAFLAIVAMTVPLHLDVREPVSRTDDNRTMAEAVRDHRLPGDAFLFRYRGYRLVMAAYPDAFRGLRDVALRAPAAQAADLQAAEVEAAALPRRLLGVRRVWFIDSRAGSRQSSLPDSRAKAWLIQRSGLFEKAGTWPFKGGAVYLYVRR